MFIAISFTAFLAKILAGKIIMFLVLKLCYQLLQSYMLNLTLTFIWVDFFGVHFEVRA